MPLVRQLLHAQEYWRRQGPARRRRHPQRASGRLPRRNAAAARRRSCRSRDGAAGWTSRAGCSCCAPTACRTPTVGCSPRSRASCCAAISASWRRSSIVQRRGCRRRRSVPASSRLRPPQPAATPVPIAAAASWRTASAASRRTAASTSIVLDGDRETPLPWSNVLANPEFGTMRQRVGRGVHLGREQPREPADAVRQRSDQRSDRRGDLPARRGRSARSGARRRGRCRARRTAAAGSFVTPPGVTRYQHAVAGPRAGARRLRRPGRSGEGLAC